MKTSLINFNSSVLSSFKKGYSVSFILAIIGIAGFILSYAFFRQPLFGFLTFAAALVCIVVATYFIIVQELRRNRFWFSVGMYFGGICSLGIWPIVYSILRLKEIDKILLERNEEMIPPSKKFEFSEFSKETLISFKKDINFGVIELVLAIIIAVSFLFLLTAPIPALYALDAQSILGGEITDYINYQLEALYYLASIFFLVVGVYLIYRIINLVKVLLITNNIKKGVLIYIFSFLSLGIWPFLVAKKLTNEINETLSTRNSAEVLNNFADPNFYQEK